jgi:hypothetical protein
MNRAEAQSTLATWRELLADPADRLLYGRAVQALAAAAGWFEAECGRLEQVSRLDVVHLAELAKVNRDLREMVPPHRLIVEHVEADPAVPMVRPPLPGGPLEPVELPRRAS